MLPYFFPSQSFTIGLISVGADGLMEAMISNASNWCFRIRVANFHGRRTRPKASEQVSLI
jgi:hypothetical protein